MSLYLENLRPFHETIVNAINCAKTADELNSLVCLLKETKIPENHDAIITALKSKEKKLVCTIKDFVWQNLEEQKKKREEGGK